LKIAEIHGSECLVVTSATDHGVLYGVFALLRKIARRESLASLNEVQQPYAAIRWVNQWDNLDGRIERGYGGPSIFFADGKVRSDLTRAGQYARLLASIGINGCTINNVNAAPGILEDSFITQARRITDASRPWGVQLSISVDLSSPKVIGGSGKTVIQHICDSHGDGADRTRDFVSQWKAIEGRIDAERYRDILARLQYQAGEAIVWRDTICNWIYRLSGIPDDKEAEMLSMVTKRKRSLCSRNLQLGRCTAGRRADQFFDTQSRSGQNRVPGAIGKRDRSHHDQRGWHVPANHLLPLRLGAAVCQRFSVKSSGGD
jgi:alpha-glucuronidase